ncbi:hypothetical protein RBU49_12545 [Clostridium sp. MB40-C1]|uniref:hypothetical protein n=1 Tax=Clostridium sp. MB40-C1 TaxID=3070996 RepID=UPI0027DF682B|nr:hypothetical protein [Clostridium sp. MB40-C1]WMJ79693.1 hypothetical protein RBU49_12545 [Clostridium sp. MB40-C1]
MIIDTVVSIAIKNSMAQYDMKKIYIFNFKDIPKLFNNVDIKYIENNKINLRIKCPICGEYHCYEYKINSLIEGTMMIGGCEKIGLPIIFLGKSEKVEGKVNKYKEINKKIYAMF